MSLLRRRLRELEMRTPFRFPATAIPDKFRQAAVLILLWEEAGVPHTLLTVRASHLSSFAGQVCFPGGRLDQGEDFQQAALRETDEEVGIPADREHLRAYPGAFSGGMLQRTAIACALLAKPDLLVADEPTTALDTTTQKRIVDLLARLNSDNGMAILIISHDLGLLKEITSRLLIMRDGLLVESGPTRDILEAPKHDYTRHLINTAPKLRL